MQVAGIARKLTFQPAAGADESEIGYGVNLTGILHPWALATASAAQRCECDETPLEKSRFIGQYATAAGSTATFQDVNGLGLDATFDPINGFRAIDANGWFVGYEHWWAKNWASVFTYGETDIELTDTLPDNTYNWATYARRT